MKFKTKKIIICAVIVALTILFWGGVGGVLAQTDDFGLQSAAEKASLKTTLSLPQLVGNMIKYAMQLIGVLLVVLLLYGGFMWMTAGGDTEKIKKAQGILKNALIGLIIVVAAYSIASFIMQRLAAPITAS